MSEFFAGKHERGQGMTEYVLVLALILVTVLVSMRLTGYNLRDIYCAAAQGLGVTEACAGERVYCEDEFANLDNWKSNWGTFTIEDGKICTSGSAKNYNTCSQNMENMSDYTIKVINAELNQGNGYGIFFRGTELNGQTNGYIVQYDPGWGGGSIIMRKWINGRELPPFATKRMPGYDWYSEPHDIQVNVQGNTFTVYLNGEEVLVGQDDTYTEGGIGLRSWDDTQVCLDAIKVNAFQTGGEQ